VPFRAINAIIRDTERFIGVPRAVFLVTNSIHYLPASMVPDYHHISLGKAGC
jgi:hypothetical protein